MRWGIAAGALALSACGEPAEQQPASNTPQPANFLQSEPLPPIPPPATGPDAHIPLGEPKGAIDPKSVQAAAQVVRSYADLMEHGRFADAAKLWNDEAAAAAVARQGYPELHVDIGELGPTEGAAGSIYTTIPVVFFGDTYSKPAKVILRRVNDVPGSTAEQRHWHIERIDWSN